MLNCKPQLNGNTRDHMITAYTSLRKAQDAVNTARADMMMNVLHGRNYQHLPDGETLCCAERNNADEKFMAMTMALGNMMSDIVDAVD